MCTAVIALQRELAEEASIVAFHQRVLLNLAALDRHNRNEKTEQFGHVNGSKFRGIATLGDRPESAGESSIDCGFQRACATHSGP